MRTPRSPGATMMPLEISVAGMSSRELPPFQKDLRRSRPVNQLEPSCERHAAARTWVDLDHLQVHGDAAEVVPARNRVREAGPGRRKAEVDDRAWQDEERAPECRG